MTVLSGQSIRRRSRLSAVPFGADPDHYPPGLITPFVERSRHERSGMTFGLSVAGYDVRIKDSLHLFPGDFALAVTLERFRLTPDVIMFVMDKSSLARMGLGLGNTVAEPGWEGWLTLELTCHGKQDIRLHAGQPIAQVVFQRLDEPAEAPYVGRYQNQGPEPQRPILLDGTEETF